MTSQHLLLLVLLTSAMTAVGAIRRKDLGWSIVHGGFALASAAGYLLAPERVGLWLIVPYLVLAVLPIVGYVLIHRMIAAQRYRVASVVGRILLVLHPSANNRRLVRMIDANRRAAEGDVDEAAEILRESGAGDHVQLELLRLQNRWDEIVVYFEATGKPLEHGAAALYIRALGETGQLDRLVEVYRDAAVRWAKRDDMSEELASARLFVAAFLGQPALVEQLYTGPLRKFSPSIKQLWLAIAHDAGGDRQRAAAIWNQLALDGEPRTRAAAAFRASHPPARVDVPSPAAQDVVTQLAADLRDAATYAENHSHGRAVLSYALVAVLAAIHVYASWQGEGDPMVMYDLGLFWSPAVLDEGEWWRVVAALFLHYGWLHLAMNVLGLLWFGPFVERFLGRVRFAIVFLVGGIGGFVLLAGLCALGWREPTAALGASGGLMALIGASIGIFLRGSSRSPIAAARLRDMLAFVALQVVFDVLAPRVSMTAHMTGLVIGFVLGYAMKPRAR